MATNLWADLFVLDLAEKEIYSEDQFIIFSDCMVIVQDFA